MFQEVLVGLAETYPSISKNEANSRWDSGED